MWHDDLLKPVSVRRNTIKGRWIPVHRKEHEYIKKWLQSVTAIIIIIIITKTIFSAVPSYLCNIKVEGIKYTEEIGFQNAGLKVSIVVAFVLWRGSNKMIEGSEALASTGLRHRLVSQPFSSLSLTTSATQGVQVQSGSIKGHPGIRWQPYQRTDSVPCQSER